LITALVVLTSLTAELSVHANLGLLIAKPSAARSRPAIGGVRTADQFRSNFNKPAIRSLRQSCDYKIFVSFRNVMNSF